MKFSKLSDSLGFRLTGIVQVAITSLLFFSKVSYVTGKAD